ncbi:MAG: type I restriction-modification enzyme R subunit C-terminal domain-containing protein [Petrimonas sp.]|jgi:hypothetical protein
MTNKFQNKYRIQSARLQNWDYCWAGAYFITICTKNREHYFGEVENEEMILSEIRCIVEQEWLKTFDMRPDMNLQMGDYQVMPNHFHAIIIIGENEYNKRGGCCRDAMHCGSTPENIRADLSPQAIDDFKKQAQQELIREAAGTFNGELNEYIDNVRREHEQIIDHINIDTVTKSEWDKLTTEKAYETIKDFTEYLEKNKDEIQALSIFYNQPYNRRNITFKMIKEVMEKIKMEKPLLAPDYVWEAYSIINNLETGHALSQFTKLISLIRHACGIDSELKPYDKTIETNFNKWLFDEHKGNHKRFTKEQIEWLRMIKDHVVSSYHIEIDDLDYTPFDALGGRGKMYQLFGSEMNEIINELNEVLAA